LLSAGYYCKCDGEEFALTITLEREAIEINTSGSGENVVTTLLASISSRIRKRLEKAGHKDINISLTVRDSIISRSTIKLGENIEESDKISVIADPGSEKRDEDKDEVSGAEEVCPTCPQCGSEVQYSEEVDDYFCWNCNTYIEDMALVS